MKNKILFALLCAATVLGLPACNKNEEFEPENGRIHSATFKVQLADDADTKTALMFKMVPDWRNTDVNDIHIFETETTSGGTYFMEASKVEMTTPVDDTYEKALFYAEFDNATVIVTPPETKAGNSVFSYTAVLGQREGDTYTLPAIQYPHEESNIDPKADFLVGRVLVDRTETLHEQTFDINFHRPVALSRMFITNLEGSKVLSIKLTSLDDLTGSLTYDDIDFSINDVAHIAEAADFKHNDNSNVLTILYPGGRDRTSVFQPFFVTLAGTKRITEVEVRTDQYIYTKTYGSNGARIIFSASQFNNITMDMTVKEGGNVTRTVNNSQDIKYMLGDEQVTEENGIVYDLFEHGGSVEDFVAPTLTGAVGDVTYNSSKTSVATVDAEGVVTLTGELGDVVISAYAAGDDEYSPGSASYKITVKDSSPVVQELSFDPASLTVTLGDDFTEPTLSGAMTAVSYSSDDEEVATVNSESGKLTLVGAGEATITATAVEGEVDGVNYMETSLSYTLTVLEAPTSNVVKLERATALVAGEKYVLVSNGAALVRVGDDASSVPFDAEAVTITVPADFEGAYEWTLGQNTDSNNRGNYYDFKNGDYFFGIAMNTTANPYTYSVMLSTSKSSTGVANTTIQNHNVNLETGYVYYRGNSSSQYIYYDSATSAWNNHAADNGTFDAAYGTQLYKVKDERAEQNLQFSAAAAEYDLYTSTWTVAVPTLQNPQGTVTYESGNTAVATVNNSGEVTIASTAKKGDTAVITANAAGNTSYKPASASYTISIVNSNPNVTRYEKVTNTAGLEVGAKYLLVFEGLAGDEDNGDPKVFDPVLNSDGTQFAKAKSSALDVTIVNSTIESFDYDDCQFTLEPGYYLKGDKAVKYIYPGASGSSSVLLAESTASHALTIAFSDGIAQIKYDTRYIVWSTYSQYFSSNEALSGDYSTGICLYKLDDDRTPQTLAFSAGEAEYDLGTSTWTKALPNLSGYQTTPLTWSSTNEAVATVDDSGNVTPLAKGTTTISAMAPATTTFKPGYASFTVTVVNSNLPKYVKADNVVAGKQYLIVSNGYALKNNNSSTAGAEAVEVVSGVIMYDAPASVLWTAAESSGKFTFKNDTRSLYRSSSNIQLSTSNSSAWSYDATNEYLTTAGSSSTYYFYYNASNSRFSVSNSQNNTYVTALYVLDDGSTPSDPPTPSVTYTYTLINGSDALVTGTYLIVEKTGTYLYNASGSNNGGYSTIDGTTGITHSGSTITLTEGVASAYEFVFTRTDDNLTIKQVGGTHAGQYMFASSNVTNSYIGFQAAENNFTINPQTGDLVYFRTTKGDSDAEYLYKKAADSYFKLGKSGAPSSTNADAGVYLYKKD
jgi:hypothetical protein